MNIQESGEMYLESIYVLTKQNGRARSVDVADYLGFSRPSVSQAVKTLRDEGLLTVGGNGNLCLTESGIAAAARVYERHVLIAKALVQLGVSEETASKDACRIEHVLSDETFHILKNYLEKNEQE